MKETVRRHGISEKTYSTWKAKYGNLGLTEAKRLKQLEEENARLHRSVRHCRRRRDGGALRELVYPSVGISLNDEKRTLVESRLQRRLRLHKFGALVPYVQLLATCKDSDDEIHDFICAGTGDDGRPPHLQEARGPWVKSALRAAPRRR